MILLRRQFFFAALTVLFGCTAASPNVKYYTLNAPPYPEAGGAAGTVILLGPLTLPEIVDRVQLVVRSGDNRVKIIETSRWAQPLKSELSRALAANLARAIGTQRVFLAGQGITVEPDFRVSVDVLRFESWLGNDAIIEVLWTIRRKGGVLTGRSIAQEKVGGADHDLLVAAYGRALEHISHEIADAIRSGLIKGAGE